MKRWKIPRSGVAEVGELPGAGPPVRATTDTFSGRLGNDGIHDIIQLLCMTRRTATVVMRRGEEEGRVFFRNGQIVHASVGELDGEDGLRGLLDWSDVDFSVEDGIESLPRVSIRTSTEALLLGSLTRLDEERNGRKSVELPAESSRGIPRRLPRPPRGRRAKRERPWILALPLVAGLLLVGGILLPVLTPGSTPGELFRPPAWDHLPPAPAASPTTPAASLLDDVEAQRAREKALTVPLSPPPRPVPVEAPLQEKTEALSPAVPLGEGFLTVIVKPWGEVEIDGAVKGETPLPRMPLSAGAHRVVIRNPGVIGALRDDVSIAPGESLVRRYDFGDVGYLLLLAEPWAEVEVDGKTVGQTPLSRLAVPAGMHEVRFRNPELGTREETVKVESGATVRARADWGQP
jgi:hypothetical protein